MARILVPLAPGFEEIETATLVDVFRRAELTVVMAGLDGPQATRGSRGISFVPDCGLDEVSGPWDLITLPGGGAGAERLAADGRILQLLRTQMREGRLVAAICAAPLALDRAGILMDGAFTCYPGWEEKFRTRGRLPHSVLDAGQVITSQGPATAMEFALYLVGRLRGQEVQHHLAHQLLWRPPAP